MQFTSTCGWLVTRRKRLAQKLFWSWNMNQRLLEPACKLPVCMIQYTRSHSFFNANGLTNIQCSSNIELGNLWSDVYILQVVHHCTYLTPKIGSWTMQIIHLNRMRATWRDGGRNSCPMMTRPQHMTHDETTCSTTFLESIVKQKQKLTNDEDI